MAIQVSCPVARAAKPPALERKDVEPCPLGTIGNLQFQAEQGGAARASHLSGIGRLLTAFWANLKFCLGWVFPQMRARRDYLSQARENSRFLGNLLGSLTVPANDEKSWPRIAEVLARISERSKGGLADLPGGQYCLHAYLDELNDSDLIALHNGVLTCAIARDGVLEQLAPECHESANEVLNQILAALRPRFLHQVVQEPFRDIVRLLSSEQVDGRKLQEPLLRLAIGLEHFKASRQANYMPDGGHYLENYLAALPEDLFDVLQSLAQQRFLEGRGSAMNDGLKALSKIEGKGRAYDMLNRICQSSFASLYEWPCG